MSNDEQVGNFALVDLVGDDGVVEVWRARRTSGRGADVVRVKRPHPSSVARTGFAEVFLDEARGAQRLIGQHVLEVLEHGSAGGRPFFVGEETDGAPLERLMRELRSRELLFPVEAAVDLAVQLCRALESVHQLDVVHGGVRPQAVFVKRDGSVKLDDFVVARTADRVAQGELGFVRGRAPYLSPERVSGEGVDARADLHAVGAILWELLTGRWLFHAASERASCERVLSVTPERPSSTRGEVPVALEYVVLRALAKAPKERVPDAASLEQALAAVVPPVGADDRAARLASFLASAFPVEGAAAPRVARASEAVVVEDRPELRPEIAARAISLEGGRMGGVHQAAATTQEVRPKPRRLRKAARVLVVIAAVAALGAFAWPHVRRVLARFGVDVPAVVEKAAVPAEPADGEAKLTPLSTTLKPPSAAERQQLERLEREAAELLLAGKPRQALRPLLAAVDLDGTSLSVHRNLAMVYREIGENDLAALHLRRYLELSPRAPDRATVEDEIRALE